MIISRAILVGIALLFGRPCESTAQDLPNLLRSGDEVVIRVWPDTALSGRFRVEPDGQAYLPMIGSVAVTGRPLEDVRAELVRRYSAVIEGPVVVVVPRFRVSILGAVRAPGLYYVEHPTTLIDLVILAGGFAENADAADIRLLRDGQALGVDAERALETGAPTAAVPLESGDRVVVPTEGSYSLLQYLQVLVSLATLFTIIVR